MIQGVNFIGFEHSASGKEVFEAFNPATNKTLPGEFHIATAEEIDRAFEKAKDAFVKYKTCPGSKKAEFLDAIAEEIMELGDVLIERAMEESGLPEGRLKGERGRTVNQIKMFSALLQDGSWVDARIDEAVPDREPAPKPDIRNMLIPLGPVVVFGASNFPLAFSTAGGDTASALAAGCPVVVKAHEAHPGTNELVSSAILRAAKKTNMPDGVFSSLNGAAEVGKAVVGHRFTKAVGFTGSFRAGTAITKAASERDEPIPVYAEMGSINPVFLLQDKLNDAPGELAAVYAQSVTLGNGQFCTKPGLIVGIKGEGLDTFTRHLASVLEKHEPGCLLNRGIAENYKMLRNKLPADTDAEFLVEPHNENPETFAGASLAVAEAAAFLENKNLSREIFGPFSLILQCRNRAEMEKVAENLEGQLTVTFAGTERELPEYHSLISICREKAGRIIFNGVPTGVEVCASMHHGGPFPATTDSKFTSVGTGAIRRFARPVAFQDWPDDLLPDELKADNPLGIQRMVNGKPEV